MRRNLPKILAVAGAVAVLAGAAAAMGFAVAESSCDASAGNFGSVLVPHAPACAGDAWGAKIGFAVLVLGTLLLLGAGVVATPRFSGRRGAAADTAPGDGGTGWSAGTERTPGPE